MRTQNRFTPPHTLNRKRIAKIAAVILSTSFVAAGAAVSFVHTDDGGTEPQALAADYPDHLVNGDFQYWEGLPVYMGWLYIGIDDGTYLNGKTYTQTHTRDPLPLSFDKSKFGWRSTQEKTPYSYIIAGEVQIDNVRKFADGTVNRTADLVTWQPLKCIYQDIHTYPGSVYKWSLKHAATQDGATDKMAVHIGPIGNTKAQPAYRTASPVAKDPLGYVGTTIHSTIIDQRTDGVYPPTSDWDVYEGAYLVPAGQELTRFTFEDLTGDQSSGSTCNHVDDIAFTISDPLFYDLNGGTSATPLPVPVASGSYPGYYQRDTSPILSSIKPTMAHHTFLGWSATKHAPITSKFAADNAGIITAKKISAGNNYVYATWGKNPIITYIDPLDNNRVIATKEILFGGKATPLASGDDDIPQHAYHTFTGYDFDFNAEIYEDTTIALSYDKSAIDLDISLFDVKTGYAIKQAGLSLSLVSISTGAVYATKTDECGHVVFNEVPLGSYDLSILSVPTSYILSSQTTPISVEISLADETGTIKCPVPITPQLSRRYSESASNNGFTFDYPA